MLAECAESSKPKNSEQVRGRDFGNRSVSEQLAFAVSASFRSLPLTGTRSCWLQFDIYFVIDCAQGVQGRFEGDRELGICIS